MQINRLKLRNVVAIAICFAELIAFLGCEKEKNEKITLKNTESYSRTFVVGDEEGASIKIQAKHFEISEIIREENAVYNYKPDSSFVGEDHVVIEVYHNRTGVGIGTTQRVKIDFTITKKISPI